MCISDSGSLQEGKGILLRPQQVEIGRQGGEGIDRICLLDTSPHRRACTHRAQADRDAVLLVKGQKGIGGVAVGDGDEPV